MKYFILGFILVTNCVFADTYEITTLVGADSSGNIQEMSNIEETEVEQVKDNHIINIEIVNVDLLTAEKIQELSMLRLKSVAIMEGCKLYITEKRTFEVSEKTDVVIDCLTKDSKK